MSSFETIRYEVDDRIETITFDRPERLNALSPEMICELRRAYEDAEGDANVWIIIVTGSGRAFCAGADVGEIPDDGRVRYDEPYLSTYAQWEAPQEGTPPFRTMTEFFDPHVSIGLVSGAADVVPMTPTAKVDKSALQELLAREGTSR